jgi:hypothetical protein
LPHTRLRTGPFPCCWLWFALGLTVIIDSQPSPHPQFSNQPGFHKTPSSFLS